MLTPNYTNSSDIRILSLIWERLTDRGVERKNEKNNEETKDDGEAKDHSPDPSLGGIFPPAGDRGRR